MKRILKKLEAVVEQLRHCTGVVYMLVKLQYNGVF